MFVAGESSGDSHAAGVARELSAAARLTSSSALAAIRCKPPASADRAHRRLAVMGFVEVLETIPQHWSLLRTLKRRLRAGNVAVIVLIDYPDFNMFVARSGGRAGFPCCTTSRRRCGHGGRSTATSSPRRSTKAAVILPFEEKLLRDHGIDATFVGHPLLDRAATICPIARRRARRSVSTPTARVLALFPGSRRQEIERHLDDFRRVRRVSSSGASPGLKVVVSAAPHVTIDADAMPVSAWFVRPRSPCCAPPTPRCARAERRRSKPPWPGVRSSWRTARTR